MVHVDLRIAEHTLGSTILQYTDKQMKRCWEIGAMPAPGNIFSDHESILCNPMPSNTPHLSGLGWEVWDYTWAFLAVILIVHLSTCCALKKCPLSHLHRMVIGASVDILRYFLLMYLKVFVFLTNKTSTNWNVFALLTILCNLKRPFIGNNSRYLAVSERLQSPGTYAM